jgi:hypothetical protein
MCFFQLPATNSDALLGHQLNEQYVRSICGSKCKSQVNLWISPELVQKSDFQEFIAEFTAGMQQFHSE